VVNPFSQRPGRARKVTWDHFSTVLSGSVSFEATILCRSAAATELPHGRPLPLFRGHPPSPVPCRLLSRPLGDDRHAAGPASHGSSRGPRRFSLRRRAPSGPPFALNGNNRFQRANEDNQSKRTDADGTRLARIVRVVTIICGWNDALVFSSCLRRPWGGIFLGDPTTATWSASSEPVRKRFRPRSSPRHRRSVGKPKQVHTVLSASAFLPAGWSRVSFHAVLRAPSFFDNAVDALRVCNVVPIGSEGASQSERPGWARSEPVIPSESARRFPVPIGLIPQTETCNSPRISLCYCSPPSGLDGQRALRTGPAPGQVVVSVDRATAGNRLNGPIIIEPQCGRDVRH